MTMQQILIPVVANGALAVYVETPSGPLIHGDDGWRRRMAAAVACHKVAREEALEQARARGERRPADDMTRIVIDKHSIVLLVDKDNWIAVVILSGHSFCKSLLRCMRRVGRALAGHGQARKDSAPAALKDKAGVAQPWRPARGPVSNASPVRPAPRTPSSAMPETAHPICPQRERIAVELQVGRGLVGEGDPGAGARQVGSGLHAPLAVEAEVKASLERLTDEQLDEMEQHFGASDDVASERLRRSGAEAAHDELAGRLRTLERRNQFVASIGLGPELAEVKPGPGGTADNT